MPSSFVTISTSTYFRRQIGITVPELPNTTGFETNVANTDSLITDPNAIASTQPTTTLVVTFTLISPLFTTVTATESASTSSLTPKRNIGPLLASLLVLGGACGTLVCVAVAAYLLRWTRRRGLRRKKSTGLPALISTQNPLVNLDAGKVLETSSGQFQRGGMVTRTDLDGPGERISEDDSDSMAVGVLDVGGTPSSMQLNESQQPSVQQFPSDCRAELSQEEDQRLRRLLQFFPLPSLHRVESSESDGASRTTTLPPYEA